MMKEMLDLIVLTSLPLGEMFVYAEHEKQWLAIVNEDYFHNEIMQHVKDKRPVVIKPSRGFIFPHAGSIPVINDDSLARKILSRLTETR